MLNALVLAQTIAVVATPQLRPTPVVLANVQYAVAVDTSLGGLVIRDLTMPPVTFAGAIRVEGIEPLARGAEPRVYADSVHFQSDGRVRLLVANGGRPPIQVDVEGGSASSGGRIRFTADGWPINRIMLVTVRPADIQEYIWRAVGWGARDQVQLDARQGFVFLSDPTTGMTVALGFGAGARGRIQEDATDITIQRRIGTQIADERRTVAALSFSVEPQRDNLGTARAELVFGLGRDAASAMQAAQSAAAAPERGAPAARLRVVTPDAAVQTLLTHAQGAAWPAASAGWVPGSLGEPYPRSVPGARALPLLAQMGAGRAICSDYTRYRDVAEADGRQKAAVATRLASAGPFRWVLDDDSAADASAESAQLLRGYGCYRATRDSLWLRAELPRLLATAAVAGRRSLDALRPDAFERLAELVDEQARLAQGPAPAAADSLRRLAAQLRGEVTASRGAALWTRIVEEARRAVSARYARLGPADAGAFTDLVTRQLFGLDERLDRIVVAPQLEGAFDDHTWRIEGFRVFDDSVAVSYRPADRAARIRITALRRRRIEVRFPWMTPTSCVEVRRGRETERPLVTTTVDGQIYFDLRAAHEPAEVTVRAQPCGA